MSKNYREITLARYYSVFKIVLTGGLQDVPIVLAAGIKNT